MATPLAPWLGAGVLIVAGLLLSAHFRAWRAASEDRRLTHEERRYYRRRFRRRTLASSLIGVLGLAVGFGALIKPEGWPALFVAYWFAVAALVMIVIGIALIDALSTRGRILLLQQARLVEAARLRAELERAKAASQPQPPPAPPEPVEPPGPPAE